MLEEGKLGKLTILELDKYLQHHNLPQRGKKADKVWTIAFHLASNVPMIEIENDEDEEDEEEVIAIVGESDSEEESGESEEDTLEREEEHNTVSRSGRQIKRATNDYFMYYWLNEKMFLLDKAHLCMYVCMYNQI